MAQTEINALPALLELSLRNHEQIQALSELIIKLLGDEENSNDLTDDFNYLVERFRKQRKYLIEDIKSSIDS